jgi:histidine kinase-like protein
MATMPAMPQMLHLQHGPHAPTQARRWLKALCRRLGCPLLAADAEILVSELTTNAVVHAGTDCVVEADYQDLILRVSVSDELPGEFTIHGAAIDAERGRGLPIVDGLAHAWGVLPTPTGKSVWFTLRASSPLEHPARGWPLERLAESERTTRSHRLNPTIPERWVTAGLRI